MIFTHGLITQSFPQLSDKQSKQKKSEEKETQSFRPPSCLLLPEEPKRGGDKPKLSKKTNIHVLVEFGLQLLCLCLKRGRLVATEENHCKLVDPFITILVDSLHSKHIRINTLSLRCLCWLLKFKLPSVDDNIRKLANGMFVILKNYASAGASKGENLELISMAFKAVTVLVRDVKIYKLNQTQLQVLLTFCEEDLYDYNRQSTAFSLLKAILSRKLNVPEVLELIKKVEGMSITADSPHVRRECRQIALQYILEYPLGKLLDKHLEFYVTQLSYEMEMGRESALEMLATIFSSFPQNILNDHAGMFFIPMSAALLNDESTKCRKLTALAIKSLLQKIDHNSRKELFNITQRWFTDDKKNHQILAAQLTGLFIEVESTKFSHQLSVILPLIQRQIDPGRYEENPLSSDGETEKDRLLFNCLNTLLKLLRECDIIRDVKWTEEMNIIWEYVVSHLEYEHMWVRLASCQLIGLLFAAWTPEEILQPSSSAQGDFIKSDSIKKLDIPATVTVSDRGISQSNHQKHGVYYQVFHEDLFGQVAEEKEVAGVTSKLFDARFIKSYDSYKILAQVISKESLMAFITPLKVLDTTHSHTIARKVQEVLKKVVTGLLDNPGLDTESLMIFTHGLITQSFPQLSDKQSKRKKTEEKETQSFRPPSCLLLPEEPKRGEDKPKLSKKTNNHVLVEFGLQLLCLCLKRGRLVATEENHYAMCWLLKFKLPSVDDNIRKLANGMFVILKNYDLAGASKGENLELISMAFKYWLEIEDYKLNQTQLQVLLTFCEEDLYDYNRQSTAFSLLKTRKQRGYITQSVGEGMSITADSPHVRRECRQIALQYILEYPLGKLLDKHLEFYVTQLSYEMEMGRESALEMLATIFSSFPQNILNDHAGMFFIPMSAALVNDESTKCRKLTALAIKSLLQKIDHNSRKELFNINQRWFTDDKINHRILAAQLTGLFIEVESTKFSHHLSVILPLIQQQIDPGRYEENPLSSDGETEKDRLLFNCLNTLLKLLRECDIIRDVKWTEEMNIIWEYVVSHLGYEHMWVRLASCQLIGQLFAAWTPEEILQPSSSAQCDFIKMDSIKKLESLALDLISQLQSQFLTEELANQIIKNMVFIAKVAKLLSDRESSSDSGGKENGGTKDKKCLSLQWLIKKMIREANHEAVNQPKTTIKVDIYVSFELFMCLIVMCLSVCLSGLTFVSMDLGPQLLPTVVPVMMPALQRETNENNPNTDLSLKRLAQEVLDILKKILGVETYTQLFAKTHKEQFDRKETRKRKDAVEAVSNPQYAAKKKMKKNLAKREAKKRKIEEYRVSKKIKKRKIKDFAITS
ncbi:small subunit processome component 20 homolog [Saccostrea cucullata]|uniref:small subunit processome component 20 homolog n=1 Tax=Saccostrea cuccullata TaxID=36930 RepID=UPI002ED21717